MAASMTLSTIFSAIDRVTGPARTIFGKVDKSAKSSTRGIGAATKGIAGFTRGLLAAQAIQRGIQAITSLGKEGLQLASDLIEVQNVVDTTFGGMADTVNTFSREAMQRFGLTELQAKRFSGTIGAMLKSSGVTGDEMVKMSTDLTALAGDLASFYNLDHEEAFRKIRSGISGETEPLKQIGINMSVANMEAFALSQGIRKQWKDMKQGEQTQLRYRFLMAQSADAQGDFSKTLETSFANQKRVLQSNVQSIAASAMGLALPLIMRATKGLNSLTSSIGGWIEANKGLIGQHLETVFGKITQIFSTVGPVVGQALAALLPIIPPLLALIEPILGIFSALSPLIITAAQAISAVLVPALNLLKPILDAIGAVLRFIVPGLQNIVSGVGQLGAGLLSPGEAGNYGLGTPVSPNAGASEASTLSEMRSTVDVNFANPPPGTAIRQSGRVPGVNINTGASLPGSRAWAYAQGRRN